jgi:hypothetical protein
LPLDALDRQPEQIALAIRWGRAQGHPHHVWPDVSLAACRESVIAIERATSAALSTSAPVTLTAPAGARALGIAGFTSGLGPLLGFWIASGHLTTDPDTAALLALHLAHGRLRWQRMQRALHAVVGALAKDQISVLVLKGAHTAPVYFPEPGTRPAVDLDIVLPPADAARAARALLHDGFSMIHPGRRYHRSEWLLPGSTRDLRTIDLMHAENPLTLEVHTSLARGFHGIRTVRLDSGPGQPYAWPGGGPAARVLRPSELLAFLAVHASEELHRMRLIQLVELVLVARRDFQTAVAWDEMMAVLAAARAERFAFPALALANRLAPGAVPDRVLHTLGADATPRLRRVVNGTGPGLMDQAGASGAFAWTKGPWEALRRALFMVWPQEEGRTVSDVIEIYRRRFYRVTRARD